VSGSSYTFVLQSLPIFRAPVSAVSPTREHGTTRRAAKKQKGLAHISGTCNTYQMLSSFFSFYGAVGWLLYTYTQFRPYAVLQQLQGDAGQLDVAVEATQVAQGSSSAVSANSAHPTSPNNGTDSFQEVQNDHLEGPGLVNIDSSHSLEAPPTQLPPTSDAPSQTAFQAELEQSRIEKHLVPAADENCHCQQMQISRSPPCVRQTSAVPRFRGSSELASRTNSRLEPHIDGQAQVEAQRIDKSLLCAHFRGCYVLSPACVRSVTLRTVA
jgi:hypothetical protein